MKQLSLKIMQWILLAMTMCVLPPAAADGFEQWTKYYDGGYVDWARAMTTDAAGNVYVAGMSWDENDPRGFDYVVIKYSGAGQQQWIRKYATPTSYREYDDIPAAIKTDSSGNVYVTGKSVEIDSLIVPVSTDITTIKYDAAGQQQWVAVYPGGSLAVPRDMAVDAAGNVYVTAAVRLTSTTTDYMTIQYDNNGQQQWVQYYNGADDGYDMPSALATDAAGNVYVTGKGWGGMNSGGNYTTIKYNIHGEQLWVASYMGTGNSEDFASDIAVDAAGSVYVTGTSVPVTSGSSSEPAEAVTVKYNSSGQQQWVSRTRDIVIGNSSYGFWYDERNQPYTPVIDLDPAGNVYIATTSVNSDGSGDYLAVKYINTGQQKWSVNYEGPPGSNDYAAAMRVDAAGNVYVTGSSRRTMAPAPDEDVSQDYEITTVKYDTNGQQQWVKRYSDPDNIKSWAAGLAVDTDENVYVTGTRRMPETTQAVGTIEDIVTIKYIDAESAFRIQPQVFEWMHHFCYEGPSRLPGSRDLPLPVGYPACPPAFECPQCSFSARARLVGMPAVLEEIYRIYQAASDGRGNLHLPRSAREQLLVLLPRVPVDGRFDEAMKQALLQAIKDTEAGRDMRPDHAELLRQAINAIELDRRMPRLHGRSAVVDGDSVLDFDGVASLVMVSVQEGGTARLQVRNGVPAAAQGYATGWPLATYDADFAGTLNKDGYVDVSLYIGGTAFTGPLSAVRILQWDGKYYRDITTHVDVKRKTVSGRTGTLSSFVVMTPERPPAVRR